jgi:hypothetical protein
MVSPFGVSASQLTVQPSLTFQAINNVYSEEQTNNMSVDCIEECTAHCNVPEAMRRDSNQ